MTIYVLRLGGLGLQGKSMLLTMRRQAIETHLQFWVRPITITSITPNTTYKEKLLFVFSKFWGQICYSCCFDSKKTKSKSTISCTQAPRSPRIFGVAVSATYTAEDENLENFRSRVRNRNKQQNMNFVRNSEGTIWLGRIFCDWNYKIKFLENHKYFFMTNLDKPQSRCQCRAQWQIWNIIIFWDCDPSPWSISETNFFIFIQLPMQTNQMFGTWTIPHWCCNTSIVTTKQNHKKT